MVPYVDMEEPWSVVRAWYIGADVDRSPTQFRETRDSAGQHDMFSSRL